MSKEKLKILEMLQEGKITTEEAKELLEQVTGDDDQQSYSQSHDWEQSPPHASRPYIRRIDEKRMGANELLPLHSIISLLGVGIGGFVGFITGGGAAAFVAGGWIQMLIGLGVGGLIGGIVALVCDSVIILGKRKKA